MRAAQAAPVGWIKSEVRSISPLDHMVGEHAVLWLRFRAALPRSLVDLFASPAGTGDNDLTPLPKFRSAVEAVRLLRFWLNRAAVECTDERL